MSHRPSQRQYVALLALIAGGILIVGAWLRPETAPKATVSQAEMLRLQALTQRRNLENLAVYFSEIAAQVQPGLVWLNEAGTSGLVWNQSGLVVTAGPRRPLSRTVTALTTTGEIGLEPQILSTRFPVASLRAPPGSALQPVRRGSAQRLDPGMWIVLVSRQAGGNYLFTPSVFAGVATTRCGQSEYQTLQTNLPLTEAALGGGLFDVDGNLLAMVMSCGEGYAAALPDDLDAVLARARSPEGLLLRSYGLRVASLDDVSRSYFQAEAGALVMEVADGQSGDLAGMAPGDLITAVDEKAVQTPADLFRLMQTSREGPAQVQVLHSRRTLRMELAAGASQPLRLQGPPTGYLVEAVVSGSRADLASVRAGDRLLLVDGRIPASVAAARRTLSGQNGQPVFVVLHRDSVTLGTFLK